jgi:mono/diheme cytochrome c family protein
MPVLVQNIKRVSALVLLILLLSACNQSRTGMSASDDALAGKALYEQSCAACHGIDGEGQSEWKTPGENGVYPAPPHTAEGHTWHHADPLLLEIMTNGGTMPNSGMPGFSEQLTDDEMVAILAYIKTFWGEREVEFQELVTKQYIGSSN